MKKQIPNLITSLNVIAGTMAVFAAMYGQLEWAAALILLGMVFDFFDGLAARLLHVKSEMGKELDSLADMVSFALAPAVIAHLLIKELLLGGEIGEIDYLVWYQQVLLFVPVVIPAFSAYRLAKFNLDIRQTVNFIGMPTPANALFWVSLVFARYHAPALYEYLFGSVWVLAACAVILSVLLISELPMFSLKSVSFSWQENRVRYLYLLCLVVAFALFGVASLVFIIPLYILFSVAEAFKKHS